MAQITAYLCDVCGKQRGESNHWFRASLIQRTRFVIVFWDQQLLLANEDTEIHICGLGCATKAMLKAMEQTA